MTITYDCSVCGHKFDVDLTPHRPAKTWGHPDSCYPAEGGECEPDFCGQCSTPVDEKKIIMLEAQAFDEERVNAAERAADLKRERIYGV